MPEKKLDNWQQFAAEFAPILEKYKIPGVLIVGSDEKGMLRISTLCSSNADPETVGFLNRLLDRLNDFFDS